MSDVAETRGLIFRGLARTYETLAPWGYTLMRFSAGRSWFITVMRSSSQVLLQSPLKRRTATPEYPPEPA